jgi:hypothetical protein
MEFKKGDVIQVLETAYTIAEKMAGLKGVIKEIPGESLNYFIVLLEYSNMSKKMKYLDHNQGEFKRINSLNHFYAI